MVRVVGAERRSSLWPWWTAWSLQGAAVAGVDQCGIESPWVRLATVGAAAALPLVGLYLWHNRRARATPAAPH